MFRSTIARSKSGFTLIEIIVVLGILAILGTGASILFMSIQSNNSRELIINEITTVIRSSQTRAMYGESQSEFGVQFFSNRYVEFVGTTYSEGNPDNVEHLLPAGVSLSGVNFNGESSVYFTRIIGEASSAGSLEIQVVGRSGAKRLTINELGVVNVQEV